MQVSKKLSWQKGGFAIFAEVNADIERSGANGIEIRWNEEVEPRWSCAISFAANLFTESFAWEHPHVNQSTMRVLSIGVVPGDTSVTALAYVAFHALCAAYNLEGEHVLNFDRLSGSFSIRLPIFDQDDR